jgi:hypothetical protein
MRVLEEREEALCLLSTLNVGIDVRSEEESLVA